MNSMQRVKNCIAYTIGKHPFFCSFLYDLKLIEDHTIETACTNGKTLKFNPVWIESLDRKSLMFVVLHEAGHIFLKSHLRQGNRNTEKWNVATDYAINQFLLDYGYNIPSDCIYDEQYKGKTAEKIYSLLPDDEKQQQEQQGKKDYGQSEQDNTQSQEQVEQLENEIDQKALQAVQLAQIAGNENGFLKQYIENLTKPVIAWQELLKNYFDQFTKNDYTWTKPNTRYLSSGFILPSLQSKEIGKINCFLDCSGSVNLNLFNKFVTELKDISKEYNTTIDLIIFDTRVYQVINDYQSSEQIHISGGGTNYTCISDYLKESDDYSVSIIFTDGYCSSFGNEFENALWIIYENNNFKNPFGEMILIKEN